MNPAWRERLLASFAAVVAVWLAFGLAEGSWLLPIAVGVAALAGILVRLTGKPLDVLAIGFLLFGYIVGNRGFAQLMPIPGIPLLPAEAGLGLAGACLLWRCARDRTLPWQRDALSVALLVWMIVGTARFAFDFRAFGFLALRDYAMVYYVAFFFIAQQLGRDPAIRRFLFRSLLVASAALPVVFALFEIFPEFFLGTLVLRGAPLIYFKGDLAPAFLALCGIVLFLGSPAHHRWWARPLAIGMITWVFTGDNRASMLGTVVALGWIACSRFRRFALLQAGVLALALLLLVSMAGPLDHPWAARKVRNLADRAMSVADISGRFAYRYEEGLIKSDNNQFRWIWWRSVVSEALDENPALGLGFGYDLARGFLQEYNPDLGDDFTARSPHNILVTTFGRMGLIGAAILAWVLLLIALRTWRVVRAPDSEPRQVALWCGLWPIAISALLGVVLEGPMGAVVFWTVLGLANTHRIPITEDQTASTALELPQSPALELPARPAPALLGNSESPVPTHSRAPR